MKKKTGLTLVEVLITMTLLLFVWAAMSQALFASSILNQTNRNQTTAQNHLTSTIEFIHGYATKAALLQSFPPSSNDGDEIPRDRLVPMIWSNSNPMIPGETVSYRFPNYDPDNNTDDDGIENEVPQALQVVLTVRWEEKGRPMSRDLLTIYNKN